MNLLYKGSLDVALDRALACTDQYLISHIHQPHIELAGGTTWVPACGSQEAFEIDPKNREYSSMSRAYPDLRQMSPEMFKPPIISWWTLS